MIRELRHSRSGSIILVAYLSVIFVWTALMMEASYRPKGWLGLIMGTRMYYKFHGDDLEDEAVFQQRMDSLTREIGDRGKSGLSEAVPPGRAWAPTPAPVPTAASARAPARASAPTPAPAPALAPATQMPAATPDRSFTPTVQTSPMTQLQQSDALQLMERMEARLEKQQEEMEKLREEAIEARIQAAVQAAQKPQEAFSGQQLMDLQARLVALHEAKLLTEDECFILEDLCADYLELKASVGSITVSANEVGGKLLKLIALSEGIDADARFARQARRKFV
jgi:hypothetical protein